MRTIIRITGSENFITRSITIEEKLRDPPPQRRLVFHDAMVLLTGP